MTSAAQIEKILSIIQKAGSKGIIQSELRKKLGISDKKFSKIVIQLEKKGLIKRERVLYKSRYTYRLIPVRPKDPLESIRNCPCFECPHIDECGIEASYDPRFCPLLDAWLFEEAKKLRYARER